MHTSLHDEVVGRDSVTQLPGVAVFEATPEACKCSQHTTTYSRTKMLSLLATSGRVCIARSKIACRRERNPALAALRSFICFLFHNLEGTPVIVLVHLSQNQNDGYQNTKRPQALQVRATTVTTLQHSSPKARARADGLFIICAAKTSTMIPATPFYSLWSKSQAYDK